VWSDYSLLLTIMISLALLSGLAAALVGSGMTGANLANGIFGSVVAVTGDAHQAQVAQDIFRAEFRHELSLMVREDMRDVHALMVETVSTQVTMGSIILGVCFAVLIEGYQDSGPQPWVVEMWAMFTSWAMMLTFVSLLLAMYFQQAIKNAVRERLLMKHRIDTPNDIVISSLGGYSLAEQVALFHTRIVGGLGDVGSWFAGSSETSQRDDDPARQKSVTSSPSVTEAKEELEVKVEIVNHLECDDQFMHKGCLLKEHRRRLVKARKGVQAWFDEKSHMASDHKIADLPNFLVGATLIRQPWQMSQPKQSDHRLTFDVEGEATLYVAGQLMPSPEEKAQKEHAFKEESCAGKTDDMISSMISKLELERLCKNWNEEHLPKPVEGMYDKGTRFQRVEGFSVFVEELKVHLPLYKLPLRVPKDKERTVRVEVEWKFPGECKALLAMVREGCVVTSEEEHPKRAFLQEIEVLRPLLRQADKYIRCGTTCLLCSVFFMHICRVGVARPWPECRPEILACAIPMVVALIGTWALQRGDIYSPFVIGDEFSNVASGDTSSASAEPPDDIEQGSNAVSPSSAAPPRRRSTGAVAAVKKALQFSSPGWWRRRQRTTSSLTRCSVVIGMLFLVSVLWCAMDAVVDVDGVDRITGHWTTAARAEEDAYLAEYWTDLPVEWPPLMRPEHLVFSADGETLWVASDRLLAPMAVPTQRRASASGGDVQRAYAIESPRMLPSLARGLCLLGDQLVVTNEEGDLYRVLDAAVTDGDVSHDFGLSGLLGEEDHVKTAPVGSVAAFGRSSVVAGAPSIKYWGWSTTAVLTVLQEEAFSKGGVLAATSSSGEVSFLESSLEAASGTLSEFTKLKPETLPPSARTAGSVPISLHLCVVGACSSEEAWLWIAYSAGSLVAVGLGSGEALEVQPPWRRADHAPGNSATSTTFLVGALSGNSTHLLAAARGGFELRVAPYKELLDAGRSAAALRQREL